MATQVAKLVTDYKFSSVPFEKALKKAADAMQSFVEVINSSPEMQKWLRQFIQEEAASMATIPAWHPKVPDFMPGEKRRYKAVRISLHVLLTANIKPGNVLNCISNDIPDDAELVAQRYNPAAKCFEVLLAHPSFPATGEDEFVPQLRGPVFAGAMSVHGHAPAGCNFKLSWMELEMRPVSLPGTCAVCGKAGDGFYREWQAETPVFFCKAHQNEVQARQRKQAWAQKYGGTKAKMQEVSDRDSGLPNLGDPYPKLSPEDLAVQEMFKFLGVTSESPCASVTQEMEIQVTGNPHLEHPKEEPKQVNFREFL